MILSGLVLVAGLAFHAWYAFHGIALFDEGILLDGADRTLRGELFARDFHAPYGPGRYWLTALWLRAFGSSVGSWRVLAMILQAGSGAALFVLARRSSTTLGALLAAAMLAVAHGSLHKSFLLLAIVLVLVAIDLLTSRPTPGRAAAAGVLLAVASLLRYDAGLFGMVAALGGLLLVRSGALDRRVAAGACLGAAAGVGALIALILVIGGADPGSWWDHTMHRIAVQERIDTTFPWPWDATQRSARRMALLAALLVAFAVPLITLAGVVRRRLGREPLDDDPRRAAWALAALLLLNQARLIPSPNHLFQVAAPVYLLLADLLARRGRRGAGAVVLAVLALLLTLWVHRTTRGPYPGSYTMRQQIARQLDVERGRVLLGPRQADAIEAVVATIREQVPPGETIVTAPGCPLFGFLADRPLALPYAEPSYYYHDERFQQEAVEAIERHRPRLFVNDVRPAATFTLQRDAPRVAALLAREYSLVATFGPYEIHQRLRGWR